MEKKKDTASGRDPELSKDSSAPAPINSETGQYKDHWVLPESERLKGFVRPVRRTYTHIKCGVATSMGQPIAETYARDPKYYGSTFCIECRKYLPVGAEGDFVWEDGSKVGT